MADAVNKSGGELELHPLCTLFPRLTGSELSALRDDIKAHGLREPIVLHEGMILDGGNRYAACVAAGVEPTVRQFDGDNIVAFVLSANLHRRHMTAGQQAAIVASAQDWARAQPRGGDGSNQHRSKPATLPVCSPPLSTVAYRAATAGASERTQRMADKVAKADPALAKKVAHGEVSLPAAVGQITGKRPGRQRRKAGVQAPGSAHASPTAKTAAWREAEQIAEDAHGDFDPVAELGRIDAELRAACVRIQELEGLLNAADGKAALTTLLQRLDHAERVKTDAMADAARLKSARDFYEKQLARCGRAVGQPDLDKVAPAVESFVRAHTKVAA